MAGTLTISTLSDGTNSTSATNCIQGSAKAWVCFGYVSSAVVVRKSYNISSITRTATGAYVINFTTAMPDENYSSVGSSSTFYSGSAAYGMAVTFGAATTTYGPRSTTQLGVNLANGATLVDALNVSISVFD